MTMRTYIKNKSSEIKVLKKEEDGNGGFWYKNGNEQYRMEELYPLNEELMFFNGDFTPFCIAHFHGNSFEAYKKVQKMIANKDHIGLLPNNVDIISCWTDEDKCILKKQLEKHNIFITNAVPQDDFSKEWYMPNKIRYYINALEKSTKEYVLLMDGYDTLVVSFDDLFRKYVESGKDILFNASRFNYPAVNIDIVPDREDRGESKYFNAGVCIGKRVALIKFYKECLGYIEKVFNPRSSEQLVIRYAFSKYSKTKSDFVDFDYKNRLFRTFGKSVTIRITDTKYLVI